MINFQIDNMDYSAEQINKAFDNLPKLLSKAIFQTNIEEKKIELNNTYKIHLDLMTMLSNYITFTLIGLMKMEDFELNIIKDLGLSKEDSENIIKDVNETIFLVVRNKMKSLEEADKLIKELQEQNEEIPIPIPPYIQKETKNNQIKIKKEEIITPTPNNETPKSEPEIYAQAGIELLDEKHIKKNNPHQQVLDILKDTKINIIDEKLNKPTKSDSSVSDYTIPKMSNEKEIDTKSKNINKEDIYREKI